MPGPISSKKTLFIRGNAIKIIKTDASEKACSRVIKTKQKGIRPAIRMDNRYSIRAKVSPNRTAKVFLPAARCLVARRSVRALTPARPTGQRSTVRSTCGVHGLHFLELWSEPDIGGRPVLCRTGTGSGTARSPPRPPPPHAWARFARIAFGLGTPCGRGGGVLRLTLNESPAWEREGKGAGGCAAREEGRRARPPVAPRSAALCSATPPTTWGRRDSLRSGGAKRRRAAV